MTSSGANAWNIFGGLSSFALLITLSGMARAAEPDRPSLAATTLDDHHFSLAEERGRVVLVNFWATWCAPCRTEMPVLDSYYRARHRAGLDMLAISLDEGVSRRGAARATARFAFPVALLSATKIAPADIPTRLPVTRIYARDGALRYDSSATAVRRLDAASLAAIVDPLLRASPESAP